MKAVAMNLAEIKVEVLDIEKARQDLQDEDQQRDALADIMTSSLTSARKAEEIINRISAIRVKLTQYAEQVGSA